MMRRNDAFKAVAEAHIDVEMAEFVAEFADGFAGRTVNFPFE